MIPDGFDHPKIVVIVETTGGATGRCQIRKDTEFA